MRRIVKPVRGCVPAIALVLAFGTTSALRAQGVGAPATGSTAAGAFNPFANPYTNPFLNPFATQQNMDRSTAALYFLSAGRVVKQQQLEQQKAAAQSRRAPRPGSDARRAYTGTGTRFGGRLDDYYGNYIRYSPE